MKGEEKTMTIESTQEISKILLVDDEENITRAISRLLMEEEDLDVLTASSGDDGLDLLRRHPNVALILSDQRMPGMSGAEFLQLSKAIAPEAIRMVLTGYADISLVIDAINKGGAARYITKPWDDGMLVQTIRDGVKQFRLLQENRRLSALVQKQNDELKEWNTNLKQKVMEHTVTIRKQNEDLAEKNRLIGESFKGIIAAFSRLVELCGRSSQSHSRNVATMAIGIAKDLGLPEKEQEMIQTAALLHDIGEIGIPTAILEMKMSAMNTEEKRVYLQHAVRGQTAIDAVEGLREVGVLIRHHHEHFDGSGFPEGIAGEAIPLGARIIAIADFIDREMANQSGEIALNMTLSKVLNQQGHQLDPTLVKHAKRYARYQYFTPTGRQKDDTEREYQVSELVAGLQLTRNFQSGTGLLLLAKGTILDWHKIDAIRRYYQIDPPQGGIFAMTARQDGD